MYVMYHNSDDWYWYWYWYWYALYNDFVILYGLSLSNPHVRLAFVVVIVMYLVFSNTSSISDTHNFIGMVLLVKQFKCIAVSTTPASIKH